ncbi:hypothetical protein ADIS_3967 [Lunatimonas lonarensis]|uniref:Uncharacterized protein n=1 Tax=Lunatimonas lonarensis TaxID=1232681 RepID=R7ZNE1_9BACT|nr:hypothetical protein [Lunatimonas lonarensis]EON75564.1 hypothetical protein ADIS_3967 [Lunatimonas lonarensis]
MRLIIATLVALSATFASFAATETGKPDPVLTFKKVGDSKYQLKYLSIPDGKVVVSIKNGQNAIVYKDVIDADKVFFRNYDLGKLELGTYSFQVSDSNGAKMGEFQVSLAPEQATPAFFADTKVLNHQTIALLVNNLDKKEKTLRIYEGNAVIHEEKFSDDQFGKKFNFKNLRSLRNVSFEIVDAEGFGKFVSVR